MSNWPGEWYGSIILRSTFLQLAVRCSFVGWFLIDWHLQPNWCRITVGGSLPSRQATSLPLGRRWKMTAAAGSSFWPPSSKRYENTVGPVSQVVFGLVTSSTNSRGLLRCWWVCQRGYHFPLTPHQFIAYFLMQRNLNHRHGTPTTGTWLAGLW